MINLHSISEEAIVQVIQERILIESMRTVLSEETFNSIMEYQSDAFTASTSLDPKIQFLIREVVPQGTGEVIIVPVLARRIKGLICFCQAGFT